MAVLALFANPSMTKAHYQRLRKEVGWEVPKPPGGIFDVAGCGEKGGIHVADVWESAEALNHFVNSRLMPAMQKHGISAPSVEVIPVHNANAYYAIDAYRVKS